MAQQLRAQQEQMGDIEFEMGIAPYFNYKMPEGVASKARFQGWASENGPQYGLNLHGYTIPEDASDEDIKFYKKRYGRHGLGVERGTINAVSAKDATNRLWSHELDHLTEDGRTERGVRLRDAARAITESDWKSAVDLWKEQIDAKTHSEAEENLLKQLSSYGSNGPAETLYREELERGANLPESQRTALRPDGVDYSNMRKKTVYWPKRLKEIEEYKSWNKELKDRNDEREKYRKENK